ncbi:DUF7691 family protein [Actinomadura vinacea]
MPYAVNLDGVTSMIGSRSEKLLKTLLSGWARDLEDYDGLRDDVGQGGADVTSAQTALRHMVMGEEYDDRVGFIYAYCLKIFLAARADTDFLSNNGWSGMRFGWFETVASELKAAGVDFDPLDLIFGGSPVRLPPTGGFPNIGHLGRAEMPAILAKFEGMDADMVTEYGALDAIRQIESWLRTCVNSNRDLICYYH